MSDEPSTKKPRITYVERRPYPPMDAYEQFVYINRKTGQLSIDDDAEAKKRWNSLTTPQKFQFFRLSAAGKRRYRMEIETVLKAVEKSGGIRYINDVDEPQMAVESDPVGMSADDVYAEVPAAAMPLPTINAAVVCFPTLDISASRTLLPKRTPSASGVRMRRKNDDESNGSDPKLIERTKLTMNAIKITAQIGELKQNLLDFDAATARPMHTQNIFQQLAYCAGTARDIRCLLQTNGKSVVDRPILAELPRLAIDMYQVFACGKKLRDRLYASDIPDLLLLARDFGYDICVRDDAGRSVFGNALSAGHLDIALKISNIGGTDRFFRQDADLSFGTTDRLAAKAAAEIYETAFQAFLRRRSSVDRFMRTIFPEAGVTSLIVDGFLDLAGGRST